MTKPQMLKSAPKSARRREMNIFHKRSRNLVKKANELASKTDTDIYVVMLRGGRYFTYSSTDRPRWPPSEADIEINYAERKRPCDFAPVPAILDKDEKRPTMQKEDMERLLHEDGSDQHESPETNSLIDSIYTSVFDGDHPTDLSNNQNNGSIDPSLLERSSSKTKSKISPSPADGFSKRRGNYTEKELEAALLPKAYGSDESDKPDNFRGNEIRGRTTSGVKKSHYQRPSEHKKKKFVIPHVPTLQKFLEKCI